MSEKEILSWKEILKIEKLNNLQRGMNFRINTNYSIILMSRKNNAPYKDKILEDGLTIEYEGHDVPRRDQINSKKIDQNKYQKSGLTQNGKFIESIEKFKKGITKPERVFMRN